MMAGMLRDSAAGSSGFWVVGWAAVMVPVGAAIMLGGFSATAELIYAEHTSFFSPLTKADGSTLGLIEFISLMAWGIGYFGQPHILVRFMAIRHAEELPQVRAFIDMFR